MVPESRRRTKLEDLRGHAGPVMNAILSPSHSLPQVIGSSGKAVVSPGKLGSPLIRLFFPHEPEIDKADVVKGPV